MNDTCASSNPGSTAAPFASIDRRLRAPVAHDFALAADVQNLVAADRHRLGHRSEIVGDVDPGVVDDQIDRTAVVVALRPDDEPGDQRGGHDGDDDVGGEPRGHGRRAF